MTRRELLYALMGTFGGACSGACAVAKKIRVVPPEIPPKVAPSIECWDHHDDDAHQGVEQQKEPEQPHGSPQAEWKWKEHSYTFTYHPDEGRWRTSRLP